MKINTLSFVANLLAGIAPSISAKLIYASWVQVTRSPRPAREESCFDSAKKSILNIDDEKISLYSWGEGPKILLLHGWGGRATQYFKFVENLLAQGYGVLSFDAPGHGESSGHKTSLNQQVKIIQRLCDEYGGFEAIIAHSFGFMLAVNALNSGVKSKAMIGISSPADYPLLLKAYVNYLVLNEKAETAFYSYLKRKHGLTNLDDISIHHLAKKIKLPCLIVHDDNDRQVPVSEAHKIIDAWQGAELYLTKGLGHSRVLYQEATINQCIEFLNKKKMC